jgi:nitrate/TMAO reductase-like tetraheme cytochrome c subunit
MLQALPGQRLHVDVRAPGDTMTVFSPPRDITVVERALRAFFSVPRWVQLTGAVLAMIVAIVAIVLVWRNARAVRAWFRTRHAETSIAWKVVIGLIAIGVLTGMAAGGTTFFVYSQNNNQFCISCHTLHDEVYQRFQQSKHHRIANLRCHDCHDEPLVAEVNQVVKWMLLRPEQVGPHAPVPRNVCASCHIKSKPDSTWQRIIATAGHSVHLQTDTAKKLGVECLTCHGVTAHRFVPVKATCEQSGCHKPMGIRLGKMADQTSLHCTTCHRFTVPVGDANDRHVALAELVPRDQNCLSCHAMQRVIERFVPANDPHKGRCGDCHNPHTQTTPAAAYKTCENSGCHARADTLTPFHRGTHQAALARCGACHQEHSWKVQGSGCLDCHGDIYKRAPRIPFPSSRRSSAGTPRLVGRLATSGNAAEIVVELLAQEVTAQAPPETRRIAMARDTLLFSHATHRGLRCTSCHSTTGPSHGSVTLRSARDCLTCHHGRTLQDLGGGTDACLHCHHANGLPSHPQTVSVMTSTLAAPTTRRLPFAHTTHSGVACTECHTTPVTLAPESKCASCHQSHHDEARTCTTCHSAYDAHRTKQVHAGCGGSGCHSDPSVLALGARRNVCLSCHVDQANHKPGRECGTCHRVQWSVSVVPMRSPGNTA